MQVEYEEEPAASPRSAAKVPPAAAEDKSEDEEEQDEEEPMQVEGDGEWYNGGDPLIWVKPRWRKLTVR
jgi:hypothetical protein